MICRCRDGQFRLFLLEKSYSRFTAWMGVFNQSHKILMTHILLKVWIYSGLSEKIYLAQFLCRKSPTDLSICSTLLENILNVFPSQLQSLPIKCELTPASCVGENCWDIIWAVLMSVTSWPCHTHQNKVPIHLSWFLQGNMGRMNTCVISTCLFASQLAEQSLAGDAHAQQFGTPWQRLM